MARPRSYRVLGIVGLTFLAMAHLLVVAWIGGAFVDRADQEGVRGGTSAIGTVVSVRPSCGKGHCFYSPVLAFTTATGQQETVLGHDGNSDPVIGSTRPVSYRVDDPSDARVIASSHEWIGILAGGVLALVLLVYVDARLLRARSARLRA